MTKENHRLTRLLHPSIGKLCLGDLELFSWTCTPEFFLVLCPHQILKSLKCLPISCYKHRPYTLYEGLLPHLVPFLWKRKTKKKKHLKGTMILVVCKYCGPKTFRPGNPVFQESSWESVEWRSLKKIQKHIKAGAIGNFNAKEARLLSSHTYRAGSWRGSNLIFFCFNDNKTF